MNSNLSQDLWDMAISHYRIFSPRLRTEEESRALAEAPDNRLTEEEIDDLATEWEEGRRMREHLDEQHRLEELRREVKEGY